MYHFVQKVSIISVSIVFEFRAQANFFVVNERVIAEKETKIRESEKRERKREKREKKHSPAPKPLA